MREYSERSLYRDSGRCDKSDSRAELRQYLGSKPPRRPNRGRKVSLSPHVSNQWSRYLSAPPRLIASQQPERNLGSSPDRTGDFRTWHDPDPLERADPEFF